MNTRMIDLGVTNALGTYERRGRPSGEELFIVALLAFWGFS